MTLGEKIRDLRRSRGLTQTQTCGDRITRNMLSQIENGSATPSFKTLAYLAETLGVTPSVLLEEDDEPSRSGSPELSSARKLYRGGKWLDCLAQLDGAAGESDEKLLLTALASLRAASDAYAAGDVAAAAVSARRALEANEKTIYTSKELQVEALRYLALCGGESALDETAVERFRQSSVDGGWEAKCHLMMARFHLSREHTQAAEREIWMITSLPDACRGEYLALRGWLAMQQEHYTSAISFLKQAEPLCAAQVLLSREVWQLLELCYKQTENYKLAYEYADKQRQK